MVVFAIYQYEPAMGVLVSHHTEPLSHLPPHPIHQIYADDTTLMAESEELKSLLVKVKAESEKVG